MSFLILVVFVFIVIRYSIWIVNRLLLGVSVKGCWFVVFDCCCWWWWWWLTLSIAKCEYRCALLIIVIVVDNMVVVIILSAHVTVNVVFIIVTLMVVIVIASVSHCRMTSIAIITIVPIHSYMKLSFITNSLIIASYVFIIDNITLLNQIISHSTILYSWTILIDNFHPTITTFIVSFLSLGLLNITSHELLTLPLIICVKVGGSPLGYFLLCKHDFSLSKLGR